LREAYKWAISIFQSAIEEVDKKVGAETTTSPAKELALRLAWYVDKFGVISNDDMFRLVCAANSLDRSEKAIALLKLAEQIRSEVE
jgi:hypothetical protein